MTRLIHITDLHFWQLVRNPLLLCNKRILGNLNLLLRRRRYVRQERAAAFLDLLPTLDADALLIGGDLTTTATEAEYKMAAAFVDALARCGPPIYMVPGNHDMYTFEARRRRRFEQHFSNQCTALDSPRLTCLPDGAPLLILPTAVPNIITSRGKITHAQLATARRILEQEAPDGPLTVLAHYPLLANPTAYNAGIMRRLGNADALRQLLGDTGRPILYLAGHVHTYSRTRDPRHPNIEQVTSAALFYDKQRHPGGFTEIIRTDQTYTVHPWRYENGWKRLAGADASVL